MRELAVGTLAPEVTEGVLVQELAEVAKDLAVILSRPVVASTLGVSATRVVAEWERGGPIVPRREHALRLALQLARIIKTRFGDSVARAWFVGRNARLGDVAPASIIRASATGQGNDDLERELFNAARAFVTR